MDSSLDDLIFVDSNVDNSFRRMTRSRTRNNRSADDGLVNVDRTCENKKKRQMPKRNRNSNRERNKEVIPVDVIDLVDEIETPTKDVQSNQKKDKVLVDDWPNITIDDNDKDEESEPLDEVKAIWYNATSKIERFSLRRTDPLLPVFEHFAKLNNVDKDKIRILTNNYKQIHQYDSMATLNLQVTNFLLASLVTNEKKQEETYSSDENMIEVKCQFKDRKQPLMCRIHRNQPLSTIAEQCAAKVNCDLDKVKLYFDGDLIRLNDTPTSLEFDGGECVDVVII